MDAERGACHPPELRDALAILGEEIPNLRRDVDRLASRLFDPVQEESDLALPVADGPHALEELVVALAVLFEVEAQVEERLPERTLVTEKTFC